MKYLAFWLTCGILAASVFACTSPKDCKDAEDYAKFQKWIYFSKMTGESLSKTKLGKLPPLNGLSNALNQAGGLFFSKTKRNLAITLKLGLEDFQQKFFGLVNAVIKLNSPYLDILKVASQQGEMVSSLLGTLGSSLFFEAYNATSTKPQKEPRH